MNHRLAFLLSYALLGCDFHFVGRRARQPRRSDRRSEPDLAEPWERLDSGVQADRQGSVFRSGESGLWQVHFRDGTEVGASRYSTTSTDWQYHQAVNLNAGEVAMTYRGADLDVAVNIRAYHDRFELSAEVSPRRSAVLEFSLPARLRFSADGLDRLVCPADGNHSVGTAFLGSFFRPQPEPTGWSASSTGPNGYGVAL